MLNVSKVLGSRWWAKQHIDVTAHECASPKRPAHLVGTKLIFESIITSKTNGIERNLNTNNRIE
jgi:hypothetical protein